MQSRPSLDLAANLFATYARETGDEIVSASWRTSDEINQFNGSNHVASVAIEICAFLLFELSRNLPVWEDDCLNQFVYSPIAMHCARQMGDLVEHLEAQGVFSESVFSGAAVQTETLRAVEARDVEYAKCIHNDAAQRAAEIITGLVCNGDIALSFATSLNMVVRQLTALDFASVAEHFQKGRYPDLLAYLRETQ